MAEWRERERQPETETEKARAGKKVRREMGLSIRASFAGVGGRVQEPINDLSLYSVGRGRRRPAVVEDGRGKTWPVCKKDDGETPSLP